MTESLHQAIEAVYRAFADVPRPKSVDGCPCCIDGNGISVLLAKPLRALSPDDLTHYAASVFLTVGSVEDFLYFFPRILEISITNAGWWPDPEVLGAALRVAGFHDWPSARRTVVEHCFQQLIENLLATEESGRELDAWICAFGRLHTPLVPYLQQIAKCRERLLEYYEMNSATLTRSRLTNAFWTDAPEEEQQVIKWFQSPEIHQGIQEAYGLA